MTVYQKRFIWQSYSLGHERRSQMFALAHLSLKRKKEKSRVGGTTPNIQTSSRDGGKTLVPLLEKGQSHWDRGEAAAAEELCSACHPAL